MQSELCGGLRLFILKALLMAIGRVNLITVRYMHVWKHHNETSVPLICANKK